RQIAPRGRRDVDDDLGAIQSQDLGHAEMPEVLADGQADAHPDPRRDRPQGVAGREEATLVEQAVRRQEELAMDMPDLAVLHQGGGDEQAMIGRLLDEADHGGQAFGRPGELGETRVVETHRDFGREVLEEVAGQAQLGEHDQAAVLAPGIADERVMALQVRLEVAETWRDLSEADPESVHAPSIATGRENRW